MNGMFSSFRPPPSLTAACALVCAVATRRIQLTHYWKPSDPLAYRANKGQSIHATHDDTKALLNVITNPMGIEILLRTWEPRRGVKRRGTVLLVHGHGWHSGYYGPLAALLTRHGFRVVAYDRFGHGRSGSVDGMQAYTDRFDDWVDEVKLVARHAMQYDDTNKNKNKKDKKEEGKLFVFTESLGTTIVLRSLLDTPKHSHSHPNGKDKGSHSFPPVAGLICSGPSTRINRAILPPAPVLVAITLFAQLFPHANIGTKEFFKTWMEAFGDAKMAEASMRDPWMTKQGPRFQTGAESLRMSDHVANHLDAAPLPSLLVLHGSDDVRSSVQNSYELVTKARSSDKMLIVVKNGRHMLLQDAPQITKRVKGEVIRWLLERSSG